jgi:hypothetical protein
LGFAPKRFSRIKNISSEFHDGRIDEQITARSRRMKARKNAAKAAGI